MLVRSLTVGFTLFLTASAFACSGPDVQGVIARKVLFTNLLSATGVLITLVFWLLRRPSPHGVALLVASGLFPLAYNAVNSPYSGDCGGSGASTTTLWFLAHLGLIGWQVVRGRPRARLRVLRESSPKSDLSRV